MITANDILTQFQSMKARFNELYTLITGEVDADANLDDLTSTSKTSEYGKWQFNFAALSLIMDGVWNDRQQQISDKVDSGVQGTDPWLQLELFKFQYGDTLLWDSVNGRYYYAVIDETKQIIKRCAIQSSGGITYVKVATLSGDIPVALDSSQLSAFQAFVNTKVQWSGAKIAPPLSLNSDKLNAPMTVYYNAQRKLDDIKAIVQQAFTDYLATALPFNGQYSINKHGDFIENSSEDIKQVDPGIVQAKADGGSYIDVNRVYTPVSGYFERDSSIDFDVMITYVPL
jgi:hypothetical protein